MDLYLAKESGFCFGVKRIIRQAERLSEQNHEVFTYGDLIHNSQEIKRLCSLGIRTWNDKIPKGSVVLTRAHGITRSEMNFLISKYNVIDGTCPIVLAVRETANDLKKAGYRILITGDINHPEIKSFLSFVDDAILIQNPQEIKEYHTKIAIVSQTTFSFNKFKSIVMKAIELNQEVHVVNTICSTSIQRQREAADIAKKVDLMVVIGGKHSSNTKKLFDVAAIYTKAVHIETEQDLNININEFDKIGIIAGASTPEWVISNVINKIKESGGRIHNVK